MDFFGSKSSASTQDQDSDGKTMEQRKQQIMAQVRSELALANAQELINKMSEKCYQKCIPKPGARLESSDEDCLAKCMDRYMEAWNIVSRVYISVVQKESRS